MDPGGTCPFLRPSLQRAEPGPPGRVKSGRPLVGRAHGAFPGNELSLRPGEAGAPVLREESPGGIDRVAQRTNRRGEALCLKTEVDFLRRTVFGAEVPWKWPPDGSPLPRIPSWRCGVWGRLRRARGDAGLRRAWLRPVYSHASQCP